MTSLVIALVGGCILLFRESLSPTVSALALTYVLQMTSLFQWGFRLWAEVSNHLIAAERFLAYSQLPQESLTPQPGDSALRHVAWPQEGRVVFEEVEMRYRPELPLVLKGVSLNINGGSKVLTTLHHRPPRRPLHPPIEPPLDLTRLRTRDTACSPIATSPPPPSSTRLPSTTLLPPALTASVTHTPLPLPYLPLPHPTLTAFLAFLQAALVGRTGAGKSSVSLVLARLCEPIRGRVLLDGVDVSSVGLPLLRRSLTFIQQDTVLFSGTIRSNLDPLAEHDDHALFSALQAVGLHATLTLTHSVGEKGGNLSAGTRQLLVLSRALLRCSRVVLLDEATANVDYTTDATLQRLIRTEFKGSTIVTVAHRLETIIDYDEVFVMADGLVAEQGSPSQLLKNKASLFSLLVSSTGEHAAQRLRTIANAE